MWGRKKLVAPYGASVTKYDGRVIPLELVYEGRHKRVHEWVAVLMVEWEDGDRFDIAFIPPQTRVGLHFYVRGWVSDDS